MKPLGSSYGAPSQFFSLRSVRAEALRKRCRSLSATCMLGTYLPKRRPLRTVLWLSLELPLLLRELRLRLLALPLRALELERLLLVEMQSLVELADPAQASGSSAAAGSSGFDRAVREPFRAEGKKGAHHLATCAHCRARNRPPNRKIGRHSTKALGGKINRMRAPARTHHRNCTMKSSAARQTEQSPISVHLPGDLPCSTAPARATTAQQQPPR